MTGLPPKDAAVRNPGLTGRYACMLLCSTELHDSLSVTGVTAEVRQKASNSPIRQRGFFSLPETRIK